MKGLSRIKFCFNNLINCEWKMFHIIIFRYIKRFNKTCRLQKSLQIQIEVNNHNMAT